jgi:hypothetical protein
MEWRMCCLGYYGIILNFCTRPVLSY